MWVSGCLFCLSVVQSKWKPPPLDLKSAPLSLTLFTVANCCCCRKTQSKKKIPNCNFDNVCFYLNWTFSIFVTLGRRKCTDCKSVHSSLNSPPMSSHSLAGFTLVKIHHHIACIQPGLSVSSVAGSDCYGWYMFWLSGFYVHLGVGTFFSEWMATLGKLWLAYLLRGFTFQRYGHHVTLSEMHRL